MLTLNYILFYINSIIFICKIEGVLILNYYQNKRFLKVMINQFFKKNIILISLINIISFSLYFLLDFNILITIINVINFISLLFIRLHKFTLTRRSLTIYFLSFLSLILIVVLPKEFLLLYEVFFFYLVLIHLMLINKIESILEYFIRLKYIKKAKRKLKSIENLQIIAITGSYGKTSLKYYLLQVLSKKYRVQASKGSINTLMGLTKFINDEVSSFTEILILEAGVDEKNGMDKILKLFTPNIAVLTSIGKMHLATFKSEDNIFKEKIKLLKSASIGLFFKDDLFLKRKVDLLDDYQSYSKNDYFIDYKRTEEGLKVKLINNQEITIPLLGIFNLDNLSAVIKIATLFNFTFDEIINILKNIKGEKHRLEKRNEENLIIIDDAYNGNFIGIKEGIEVIKVFKGKKAIITPGVIELGKFSKDINYSLGALMSELDYVFLIEGTDSDLKKGYLNNNGKINNLYIVKDFLEGYKLIKTLDVDVLLIANDRHKTYLK